MPSLKRAKYVRVVGPGDEFFNPVYLGRIGKIVGYTAKGDDAGVGDTPKDPAFMVRFAAAYGQPAVTDLFWTEELMAMRKGMSVRELLHRNWLGKQGCETWPEFLGWKLRHAVCAIIGHGKPQRVMDGGQICSRCRIVLPKK